MATIRKRQLKNGESAYTIQVKFKDKGSGKTILETDHLATGRESYGKASGARGASSVGTKSTKSP